MMKKLLMGLTLSFAALSGCTPQGENAPLELSGFIEELKSHGLDGSLVLREPLGEDMDYVAEYAIAKYTRTQIISLFKCKDVAAAERNLQEALENKKLSGQARNGTFVMAATFYPPDEQAVERIKKLFLEYQFE